MPMFARRCQIEPEIIEVNASFRAGARRLDILRSPTQTALIAELMQRWSDRDGKTGRPILPEPNPYFPT